MQVAPTMVFRDLSAWYHLCVAIDTTQATASNRVKFYVNGTQVTAFSTASYPSQNADTNVNRASEHVIGQIASGGYFSGYLADIYFIDGQALDPTSFTETDATTGQLIPKAYTGSYGTNGFHLEFADNSSNTATTLGKDTSGNSPANNWTPNNLSVTGILNYSSNVTTVATSIYNGTPATMFDGSTSTYYGVTSSSGNSSISINLSGKNVSASSTIRVYATFRTGMTWQINGSTVSSSGVTHPNTGWQTLSGWSTGAITSISNSVPSGNANEIYAIEIDSSILINNTGAGNDSLVDVPTNGAQTDTGVGGEVRGNYATWNPLSKASAATLSNGNLDASYTGSSYPHLGSDSTIFLPTSGKWYWEITVTTVGELWTGIRNVVDGKQSTYYRDGSGGFNNIRIEASSSTGSANAASYTSGDIIGVAVNCDGSTIAWYKNGSQVGTTYSLTNVANLVPFAGHASSSGSAAVVANFGQRPFAYTAPSGFKALCTANLPAPLVTKPNTVMDVKLWTGNGSTQTISGLGFSPNFVWIKERDTTRNHVLYDTIRGATKALLSSTTDSEQTYSTTLTAFNSDGFSLDSDDKVNGNNGTYVAWTWDAGEGSAVSNTQGSITSSVRANATAGFSVITATTTNTSSQTFGHGLGVAPVFHIIKLRNGTDDWYVYHSSVGATQYLKLNATTAATTSSALYANTAPTSSVITLGSGWNSTSYNIVCYAFAPVVGYSSFGSYTGNGSSTDGPFVYCGFRPRFIMVKQSSTTSNWVINDTARDTYNVCTKSLFANSSSAEDTTYGFFDILSNGFKVRTSALNDSGATMIYAAFAESPFNYARAR
jgi:hypothetical protein